MREIKFTGKRKDTGEWIIGDLARAFNDNNICIMPKSYFATKDLGYDTNEEILNSAELAVGGFYPVIPETVGEFTGLKDKNGKGAFSGDIYKDEKGTIRTIWSDKGGFCSESNPLSFGYGSQGNSNPSMALANQQTASWFEGNCEIIGNIHDIPELLNQK